MGCSGSKDGAAGGSMANVMEKAKTRAREAKDAAIGKAEDKLMERHLKFLETLETDKTIAKARKLAWDTHLSIGKVVGMYRAWAVPAEEGIVPSLAVWAAEHPDFFIGTADEAATLKKLACYQAELMHALVAARVKYGKYALAKLAEAKALNKKAMKTLQGYEFAEIALGKVKTALAKVEGAPKVNEKAVEAATAKVTAAEEKVSSTKAAAMADIEPGKAAAVAALVEALDFILIGYDKQHVIVDKVLSETTDDMITLYAPKSMATTASGIAKLAFHKSPENDHAAVDEAIKVMTYFSDQVEAYNKTGLAKLLGPETEGDVLKNLDALIATSDVSSKIKAISDPLEKMKDAKTSFKANMSMPAMAKAKDLKIKLEDLYKTYKEATHQAKEAAKLEKKEPERAAELKTTADAAMEKYTSGYTSMKTGGPAKEIIDVFSKYTDEMHKLAKMRPKDGSYDKFLEFLKSKGFEEATYDLKEPEVKEEEEGEEGAETTTDVTA